MAKWRIKDWRFLAGGLACATLFQAQCNLTGDQLISLFVQDVATVFISGLVNDIFNVQSVAF